MFPLYVPVGGNYYVLLLHYVTHGSSRVSNVFYCTCVRTGVCVCTTCMYECVYYALLYTHTQVYYPGSLLRHIHRLVYWDYMCVLIRHHF
jgi:hypothetical protein